METRYRLTFSLAVTDPTALWATAAALAMDSPYMTMDDVIETIGPLDAPQIEDCLALLLQPERFGGCEIDALDIVATTVPLSGGSNDAAPPPPPRIGVEARRDRFAFETNQTIPAPGEHHPEPNAAPTMRAMPAVTGSMVDLR